MVGVGGGGRHVLLHWDAFVRRHRGCELLVCDLRALDLGKARGPRGGSARECDLTKLCRLESVVLVGLISGAAFELELGARERERERCITEKAANTVPKLLA